jgi:hypothetical protein
VRRSGAPPLRRSLVPIALFLAVTALHPVRSLAQSPGHAIPAALQSLTHCWDELKVRDTSFSYFPGVRFIRGYCTGEHGDAMSGIVALDSDSVLYLFASSESLRFLLARHPIAPLDSTGVLAYAPVALELSGQSSGHSRRIANASEAGPGLRRALRGIRGTAWLIQPLGLPRPTAWSVFFGRREPAYEGHHEYFTEIWILRTGEVRLVRDTLVSEVPIH